MCKEEKPAGIECCFYCEKPKQNIIDINTMKYGKVIDDIDPCHKCLKELNDSEQVVLVEMETIVPEDKKEKPYGRPNTKFARIDRELYHKIFGTIPANIYVGVVEPGTLDKLKTMRDKALKNIKESEESKDDQ